MQEGVYVFGRQLRERSVSAASVIDNEDVDVAECSSRRCDDRDGGGRVSEVGFRVLDPATSIAELGEDSLDPVGSAPHGWAASWAVQDCTNTSAPRVRRRRAIAGPMPTRRLTPVTSATRPVSERESTDTRNSFPDRGTSDRLGSSASCHGRSSYSLISSSSRASCRAIELASCLKCPEDFIATSLNPARDLPLRSGSSSRPGIAGPMNPLPTGPLDQNLTTGRFRLVPFSPQETKGPHLQAFPWWS